MTVQNGPSGSDEPALRSFDIDAPRADWSYVEWEAYRLRRENDELRTRLDSMTSPAEAHRHALRWAAVVGSLGVEFALAIALTGILSVIFWCAFAAQTLGLMAYGLTMDEYRSKQKKK